MTREKRLLLRAAYVTILVNKYYEYPFFSNSWKNTLAEKLPIDRWPLQEEDIRKVNEELLLLDDQELTDIINAWFEDSNFAKSINNAQVVTERIGVFVDDISGLTDIPKKQVHDWIIEYEIKEIIWKQIENRRKKKK